MKLDKDMCNVIAELEYLIGSECSNPSAYDGWNDVKGCEFRYPVNIRNQQGEFIKVRTKINTSYFLTPEDITDESIKYMKYKFGANELFIGLGIIEILEFLETRYGIDINELERKHKVGQIQVKEI